MLQHYNSPSVTQMLQTLSSQCLNVKMHIFKHKLQKIHHNLSHIHMQLPLCLPNNLLQSILYFLIGVCKYITIKIY